MNTLEKITYYYNKGIYKESHLQKFLAKGIITQEQYNTILGITEETPEQE